MIAWRDNKKYGSVLNYIVEHRPNFIVEYGAGESTYCISQLLKELDYGARFIAFESEEYFFNLGVEKGYYDETVVRVAPVEYVDKEKGIVKYVHSYEGFKDVDLVIIDGPNLQQYTTTQGLSSNVTTNLQEIVELKNQEVPFFIDGRSGTVEYYKENLGYKLHINQIIE